MNMYRSIQTFVLHSTERSYFFTLHTAFNATGPQSWRPFWFVMFANMLYCRTHQHGRVYIVCSFALGKTRVVRCIFSLKNKILSFFLNLCLLQNKDEKTS